MSEPKPLPPDIEAATNRDLIDYYFEAMPDMDQDGFDMDVAAKDLMRVSPVLFELRQRAFDAKSVEDLRVVHMLKLEFDGLYNTVMGMKAQREYQRQADEARKNNPEGQGLGPDDEGPIAELLKRGGMTAPRPSGIIVPGQEGGAPDILGNRQLSPVEAARLGLAGQSTRRRRK